MNEQNGDQATASGERKKRLICPHCGEEIALALSWEARAETFEQHELAGDWRHGLTANQIAVAESAEKAGALKALEEANGTTPNCKPKSFHRFFVTFLQTARPRAIPKSVLDKLISEFGGLIECWSAQGVLGVTSDGTLRAFLPLEMACGASIRGFGSGGGIKGRLKADSSEVWTWLRTRNGYIPAGCSLFMKDIRKKSFGEFSRPDVSTSLTSRLRRRHSVGRERWSRYKWRSDLEKAARDLVAAAIEWKESNSYDLDYGPDRELIEKICAYTTLRDNPR
jgi:hypothetical protein